MAPFTVPPHTTHTTNPNKQKEKEKEKEKSYRSSESTVDFFGRKNLPAYTVNPANEKYAAERFEDNNSKIQNFQRNTKQFVRHSMDSKFGTNDKSQVEVEVEVPRDGRISCYGNYLVIAASDGAVRLHDCEAAIGAECTI